MHKFRNCKLSDNSTLIFKYEEDVVYTVHVFMLSIMRIFDGRNSIRQWTGKYDTLGVIKGSHVRRIKNFDRIRSDTDSLLLMKMKNNM